MNLTQAKLNTARKRLIQMHFDSGVGHIGGNLSALDSILLVFHEYLDVEDKFILSKGHSAGAPDFEPPAPPDPFQSRTR